MSDWIADFKLRKTPAAGARAATDAGAAAPTAAAAAADWPQRLQAAAGDDAALLALAREASPLDVKLAAVAALSTEAALKSAEREFRDHDRRVHRLAKQRCALALAQREARTRAAKVIEDARALAQEALFPLNLLVDIDRAWRALDAELLDAGQRDEYAGLMAELAALTRERADQPLKLRRWAAQARDALAGLQAACTEAAAGAPDRQPLDAALAAARAVIDAAPPEATGSKALDELARAVDLCPPLAERLSVLEGEARQLAQRWAQLAPLADRALDEILQARFASGQLAQAQAREQQRAEQREQNLQRQRQQREQGTQALAALLELAEAALAAGQLAPTHGHLVEIDKLLAGGESAGALRARIDAVQSRYAQLKGWQHWAGGRARDELVQQAQALAAASGPGGARSLRLSTPQLAELIDDMRARWKELDRLGGATSRALWQRFDAALKTAYEPVALQVAAQRAARETNLLARQRLLAELEAQPLPGPAAGGEAPDWRAPAVALDHFQAAWRKLGPIEHTVPNAARGPLVERLNSAAQRIEAPLQEARRVVRLQREQLLARARALVTQAAEARGRDLVDQVRELQSQWQQQARALPLPRADENALWIEFKGAIDGAFSAREAALRARDAAFSAHGAERAALIERLEGLGADTPAAQLKRTLAEVDTLWQRSGSAPRSDAPALQARFRQARDTAQRGLAESAGRAWHATCDALEAKIALCDELAGNPQATAARAELALRWSALPALPPALEQALALRAGLANAGAPVSDGLHAAAADSLLLQLEAAWGLASPPAFESARRLLKLEAMKAALQTRRPAAAPATPPQCLAELLRRSTLDAVQRERLHAAVAALRRRGSRAGASPAAPPRARPLAPSIAPRRQPRFGQESAFFTDTGMATMSDHGFHVHGPHDHEVEHAVQHNTKSSNSGLIAVVTAVVATVGALFSYMGGATQANAILYKNNAAIKKTEASNQWNYYQAKSGKQNLSELGAVLVADDKRAGFKDEVERYKKEKAEIKLAADKLEAEAKDWDQQSDAQMHVHHRWAQATTALQIAIALAAMALLTGRKWLEVGMYGVAGLGVLLGVAAALHV